MTTIGAYEAKTHLPRLLDEVAGGKTITITKHGREVARLVPPITSVETDVDAVIEELHTARRAVTRGDTPVRDMIEDGRR